jgi:hypothetical protein
MPKGDDAVIEGAKAMAMTALDLMVDQNFLAKVKSDFEATRDISDTAIAKSREPVKQGHQAHVHGACGCA